MTQQDHGRRTQPHVRTDRTSNLQKVLRINATTSGASGALALAAAPWVASVLGVDDHTLAVRLVGVGLIIFAVDVWVTADSSKVAGGAKAVSIADFAWVLGTIVLVALGVFSAVGVTLMVVVAAVVGTCGIAQLRLARSR